jgi:hypothetical protein
MVIHAPTASATRTTTPTHQFVLRLILRLMKFLFFLDTTAMDRAPEDTSASWLNWSLFRPEFCRQYL